MDRLIREDDVMRMLTGVELNNGTITDAKIELRNVKTAYDVEKVVAKLEKKTEFLKDCTKYGNESVEQQEKSYSTMMMYEVADLVDDLIDIVRKGGISEPTENKEADTK